ncbi:phage holin family protein [Microbacterium istanbulense]|uniref:Phage holin family protein n=1 Tax=Microbacterium istanbulense TaxID=3122049 RepID=A0ABU8LHX6_9MICO
MRRASRDRLDDSLLTLLGDLPGLIRNLITAEVEAAKAWVKRNSKDAGIGGAWFVLALFFLFWAVPVILVFAIAGLSSWWPVWLSALAVFGLLVVIVLIFALLGILKVRKIVESKNPVEAVAEDIRIVRSAGHDES